MKRVLTAAALLPVGLYAILAAPLAVFYLVLAAFATLCFWEFASIASAAGYPISRPIGILTGLLLVAAPGEGFLVILIAALAAVVWGLQSSDLAGALPRAAILSFGVLYVFGAWKCAALIHAYSPKWLLFALGINWIGDICAYYGGRAFGRHKLAPSISPGKTWEGAASSLVASALVGYLYIARFLPQVPAAHAILLAAAVNLAGQAGDLAESAFKRGSSVKDSGSLLPGHGGFLDRFDSSLFTMPAVYLYLRMF
ncbi:MAG: phosphatidate cytidylyltransferase [Bryobacteraceae bacterium]